VSAPAIAPFSKARIEALSDGVFAIAMTLLVLEIKVPELPREVAPVELWHATIEHWPIFFSFLVTFMLAGQFWLWHHVLCHYTRRVDRVLALLTVVFLMFVSLLPFSTAMLGAFTLRQPVSLALYFGNQLALGVMLNVKWWYSRRRGLLAIEPHDAVAARFQFQMLGHPVSCVVALLAVAVDPILSFRAFVITFMLTTGLAARRGRAAAALRASQAVNT
jgi:uncharacterized membrane protein